MNLSFEITKKQREFIEAQADEVLFGGAAGGGKSFGQLIDALLYALRYPRSKQLILRRTLLRMLFGLFCGAPTPSLKKAWCVLRKKFFPATFTATTAQSMSENSKTDQFWTLAIVTAKATFTAIRAPSTTSSGSMN